jgi:hypothetical protein
MRQIWLQFIGWYDYYTECGIQLSKRAFLGSELFTFTLQLD